MAKKYLLYIHSEEFRKEPKKSNLINHLLKLYYSPTSINVGESLQKPGIEVKLDTTPQVGTCQGHDVRWDCGGKGCKYAIST